ncbi:MULTISPECIES: biotin transporter BioY [unclassified Cytobacillus]|jgi:biotin transport system substrate-specific component|uniref:biotin transporter BioY n=1 Tax=unclassified Cytobacillus TaxID=2675268 RepID=UPI00135A5C6C|nr:biotin transporter BioY [Cytobacillus sp. AMY 15.2]KAF0817318.1 Substrate-specific component BioY of biotin ECF transporter [Bacillus sp. ZZV12-4809]MCM3092788.1 biotin transporter BioY [Cytobacillus sp. AMY 15.2]
MKVKEMTYVALFAAVMGALGLVPPIMLSFTPVPITLQTLGVLLAGGILGARLGGISMAVFLLLVAAGAPLLSGGRGGIGVFFGPSAGYLFSYPLTAFVIGYLLSRFKTLKLMNIMLINLTAGIFLIYLFGIPVQAFMMDIPLAEAIKLSLVYIPGDVLKATLASLLVYRLMKHPIINKQFSKSLETL